MTPYKEQKWHEKLRDLSYTMFGSTPPERMDRWTYWVTVVGTTIYCGIGIAIFLTLNLATLPFGVLSEPIWRARAEFRLLRFPNGIPIIPFSVAALLGYSSYREWILRGAIMAFGPWLLVATLSLVFVGLSMVYNRLRRFMDRSSFPPI
jgi:hypothetical protein